MKKNLWTRNELILTFNLYYKIPFNKINKSNQDIVNLANAIDRMSSAIAWKLVNFASLNPKIKGKGLSGAKNTSKLDIKIFNEFINNWNELSIESEILYNQIRPKGIVFQEINKKEGIDKQAEVKTRINQNFFRSTVLSSYNNQSCITGLNKPDLLITSHIIPWSKDEKNRTNPQNGLYLNALHDKAFDRGFIGIDKKYKIKILQKFMNIYQIMELKTILLNI